MKSCTVVHACIQVAVAVGKTEQLPMVFKLPYLKSTYAMAVCGIQHTLIPFANPTSTD